MGTRTVDVGLFSFSLDAYHAKAYLEENGIVATVTGVQAGTLWGAPGLEAVRVAVLEEDAERATALLKELRSGGEGASEDPESPASDPEGADSDLKAEEDPFGPDPDDEPPVDEARDYGRTAASAPKPEPDTHAADDAWARRTRAVAMVALGLWILLIPTIWRLTSPRAKGDLSPFARRCLQQAWLAVGVAIAIVGTFLLLLPRARLR